MKKYITKLICVLLCFTVLGTTTYASSIDEVKDKIEEIQQEKDANLAKIDELKEDAEKVEEYQLLLAEQLIINQNNINDTMDAIDELDENILKLTQKIARSAAEYQETLDLLKERLVKIYTAGSTSTVEILLQSQSLRDFSMRTVALETVAEYDQLLMEKIADYAAQTKDDREELSLQKETLALYQEQLELDIEDLNQLVLENEAAIIELDALMESLYEDVQSLDSQENEFNDKLAQLIQAQIDKEKEEAEKEEAEKEEAEKEDNNSSNSGGSDNSGSSGGSSGGSDNSGSSGGSSGGSVGTSGFTNLVFPVPGFSALSWVTCEFGNGHYGYDIAAYYGTPIVAVADGYVQSASYHWSWGNNVYIEHTSTYSTRSAHMSSMAVSAGDYVVAGQVIGYVGSTGYSFGNHLHFEVYKNGTRVDPAPYIR